MYTNIALEWALLPMLVKDWVPIAMAVPGPLLACVLWGRSWRAAIWFGYGAVLLVPPAVLAHVAYSIYWVIESIGSLLSSGPPPPEFSRF